MAKKKAAKKKTRKRASMRIDLESLLEELSDAQRELNRVRTKLDKLKPLCQKLVVSRA